MPVRLAACNPCKVAKVSCDHATPCGRCKERDPTHCTYRERPFKRRRVQENIPDDSENTIEPSTTIPVTPNVYPNPGFQGSSSHASIFDQVKASGGAIDGLVQTEITTPDGAAGDPEDHEAARHIKLLEGITQLDVNASADLIKSWINQGVNLALAGPLVMTCVESVATLFSMSSKAALVATMFRSSKQSLPAHGDMTISAFKESLCGGGWATVGIFLVTLSRAVEDTNCFPRLYSARGGQQKLQKAALQYADQCLETCLSLDCLNDLQLILQYESFIAHSMIDGDQSYHSWRRLGDVVSSLYALGYHERVDLLALAPVTLDGLRNAAFCRAYSADKNVSIFLGRPPRMHRSHSSLRLSCDDIAQLFNNNSPSEAFEYTQETRWTVACAVLKERVLDLARLGDETARAQESCAILQDCNALEACLPPRYHLPGHLKQFQGSAVERDFVASAALNVLHVRFLLHSSFMQRASEPSRELVSISITMLKLATEVAILKPILANSGTGFIWKIVFYGLPAAGVICLALVNRDSQDSDITSSLSQAMQDLSVLVAHVEAGVLLSLDEPNYALLQTATVTIKSVLHKLTLRSLSLHSHDADPIQAPDLWMPWAGENELLDFELDFWTNLAEHPALYTA